MENAFLVLDTALEAKVLANKDESKCLKPLIAVIRPVRDRFQRGRFLSQYGASPLIQSVSFQDDSML